MSIQWCLFVPVVGIVLRGSLIRFLVGVKSSCNLWGVYLKKAISIHPRPLPVMGRLSCSLISAEYSFRVTGASSRSGIEISDKTVALKTNKQHERPHILVVDDSITDA